MISRTKQPLLAFEPLTVAGPFWAKTRICLMALALSIGTLSQASAAVSCRETYQPQIGRNLWKKAQGSRVSVRKYSLDSRSVLERIGADSKEARDLRDYAYLGQNSKQQDVFVNSKPMRREDVGGQQRIYSATVDIQLVAAKPPGHDVVVPFKIYLSQMVQMISESQGLAVPAIGDFSGLGSLGPVKVRESEDHVIIKLSLDPNRVDGEFLNALFNELSR